MDLLRRRQHLRVGAQLGIASGAPGRQRDAARHQPAAPERHLRACCSTPSTTSATATSSTPTPSAASPTARSPTKARPTPTGTRCGTCAPASFDGGWTIEMAIPFKSLRYQPGTRPDVGRQPAPRRALEERMVVPRAGAARAHDLPRPPEDLVGRHARRPAGAVGQPQPRAQAVRARRRLDRQHRDAAPSTTTATAASAAT